MSITRLTSKGQIGGDGQPTLEHDEAPPIETAFGMLRRLAKRKPATITEMNAAVRRRARKKSLGAETATSA